jgi:hypothetical protein
MVDPVAALRLLDPAHHHRLAPVLVAQGAQVQAVVREPAYAVRAPGADHVQPFQSISYRPAEMCPL